MKMLQRYGLNLKAKFTPGPSMTRMVAKITREVKAGQPGSTDVLWNNAGGAFREQEKDLSYKDLAMVYLKI